MTHLTLTGYYAGRPLCDCDKATRKAAGDDFIHAMYAPPHDRIPDLCQECKRAWDDSEGEDDGTNELEAIYS
jgi:hypothetical protein